MTDLGDMYRCRITGFTGTATGRAEYLDDATTVQLTRADNTGKPETVWIIESRLEPAGTGTTVPVKGFIP